jgi:hypothetical protein
VRQGCSQIRNMTVHLDTSAKQLLGLHCCTLLNGMPCLSARRQAGAWPLSPMRSAAQPHASAVVVVQSKMCTSAAPPQLSWGAHKLKDSASTTGRQVAPCAHAGGHTTKSNASIVLKQIYGLSMWSVPARCLIWLSEGLPSKET